MPKKKKTKKIINVVATECWPGEDEKFNKYYSEVHTPMLLKYKGIKKATRYRKIGDKEEGPKYLGIYEFESKKALDIFNDFDKCPEHAAARDRMKETWKNGGFIIKWIVPYEEIETWET